MAWTAPMTAVANSVFTAAQFNTFVRDNLNETAPAKVTAAGQILVSTGPNAIAARTPTTASVVTAESTSTVASYGDLTTVGPTVTVTTGTKALLFWRAQIENSAVGCFGEMSFAVSGATTIAAPASNELRLVSPASSARQNACQYALLTTLTPGSNTFTAKYTTPTGGTATFTGRELTVVPF